VSIQNCADIIRRAAGRPLTLDEIQDIADKVERRITARVTAGQSRFAAAAAAGKQLAGDELLAAILEQRNAAINLRIRGTLDSLAAARPGKQAEVVRALLTGVQRVFSGAAKSVDTDRGSVADFLILPEWG
jgi:hypothetical protein